MNERIDQILGDIALFVEVAKSKSIKRAAEVLGMPDSTLSRRITELERSLGIQLLHRTTRRIELTEAGRVYYAQCSRIVEAAELARDQLKEMAEAPEGRLRLALPVDFSTLFLAPLIAEFASVFPKIRFELRLTENWVNLMEDGVDVAIRLGRQSESALTLRHMAEIRYQLYASPEYLRQAGTPGEPAELIVHDCIRMVCPHWDENWTLRRGERAEQVNVRDRVAVNNVALVRRFAVLGMGIAPLDSLLAREDVEAGRLRRVLPEWDFAAVPVFAVMPGKVLPEKTRVFVQFLTNRMREVLETSSH